MNSPALATPAWARPVFVLGAGRSGSTLLMRMVNCLDGITVWGEHGGIVRNLREAFQTLTQGHAAHMTELMRPAAEALQSKRPVTETVRGSLTAEWANGFGQTDVLAAMRGCVTALFTVGLPPDRRWGFKEIRYLKPEYDFLKLLFPDSQTILVTRDPAEVLNSQFANFAFGDAGQMLPFLCGIVEFLEFARDLQGPLTQRLRLDHAQLVSDRAAVMRELEEFLSAKADPVAAEIVVSERPGVVDKSVYRSGGRTALTGALAAQFERLGLPVPSELIERATAAYEDLYPISPRRNRQ